MIGRMATYRFSGDAHGPGPPGRGRDPADPAGLARLRLLHGLGGRRRGPVSLSAWQTRADAEAADAAVAAWVGENMAGELDLVAVRYADVLFSTTLGISTLAGATV